MMILRIILALFLFCAVAQASPFAHSSSNVTPKTETVTVTLSSTTTTISPIYTGIAFDIYNLIYRGNFSGSSGTSLCGLLSLLGPQGTLRLGGNQADVTPAPPLTQGLANDLGTCLATMGSGWQLIYNLPWGPNSPSTAVTHASYLVNAIGLSNIVWLMGNEKAPGTAYTNEWNAYYAAIIAAYPAAKFAAPDTDQSVDDTGAQAMVNSLTPGMAGLQFLDRHYYQYCCTYQTPAGLISAAQGIDYHGSQAFSGNKLALTEFNTEYSDVGAPYVGNVLAASAWFLNGAMLMAHEQFVTMEVYQSDYCGPVNSTFCGNPAGNGTATWYDPVIKQSDGGFAPSPIFYGMILMSKLAGQTIAAVANTGAGNVNSLATVGPNGNANILVVNNDVGTPVTVTPAQSNSWSTAKVLVVGDGTHSGCTDTQATLNDAAINEGGSWAANWKTITNGQTVTLQPCGAAVIEIQP